MVLAREAWPVIFGTGYEDVKANWNYPTTVWAGEGRLSEVANACQSLNIRKPLIVTDPGLVDSSMVELSLIHI